MNMYKSESTVSPIEWDLTSSGTTVYHNYNVVEKPANGDNPKVYQYDVDEYTKAEYDNLVLKQAIDDIKDLYDKVEQVKEVKTSLELSLTEEVAILKSEIANMKSDISTISKSVAKEPIILDPIKGGEVDERL